MCGTALCNAPAPAGYRQLAAVLLKQQIRQHWDAGDRLFSPPEVSSEEKAAARAMILNIIFSVPPVVCVPLGVSIAAIANWDFPEEWPEVLPTLLQAMASDGSSTDVCLRASLHCAHDSPHKPSDVTSSAWRLDGLAMLVDPDEARAIMCLTLVNVVQKQHCQEVAMRTLRVMAEDMADTHLPAVLQHVLPLILAPDAATRMTAATRRLALAVVAACVKSLVMMEEHVRKQQRTVLRGHLPALLTTLCTILSAPLPPDDSLCALAFSPLGLVQSAVMSLVCMGVACRR